MIKKEDLKVGMVIRNSNYAPRTILMLGGSRYFYKCDYYGDHEGSASYTYLKGWQEKKPEPKIEILYECLNTYGISAYYFEDGRFPNFELKKRSEVINLKILQGKTGRTLKLNMDTWELVQEDLK